MDWPRKALSGDRSYSGPRTFPNLHLSRGTELSNTFRPACRP